MKIEVLEKSIMEVHKLIEELAGLVKLQGEMIDDICESKNVEYYDYSHDERFTDSTEYMNNSVTEKQASDYDLDFTINKNLTFTMKYLNGDFIKGNINITKYEYEKENKAHEFILNLNTSYRFIDGEINLNEFYLKSINK